MVVLDKSTALVKANSTAISKTSPVEIMTARQEKIANLVLHGWSQRRVAAEIGVSQKTVQNDLKKIRKIWRQEIAKSYDDHVAQHTARYRQLSEALQPGIDKHDWKSIDTAIRLEDRVSRLLGLDMPQQMEVHISVEAIDKEINRLEAKIIDAEVIEEVE